MTETKIVEFTDLIVWQEGHKFVLMIYEVTKNFPREELFGLVSQMRRAAVSVTSNISEGFSRQSVKEKLQFYTTAAGSLSEVKNQLIISKDLQYMEKNKFSEIWNQSVSVHKLLNAFIKSVKVHDLHAPKY
jgi:four helix bundle protein